MELQIIYDKKKSNEIVKNGNKAIGLCVIMHVVGEFVERKKEEYIKCVRAKVQSLGKYIGSDSREFISRKVIYCSASFTPTHQVSNLFLTNESDRSIPLLSKFWMAGDLLHDSG